MSIEMMGGARKGFRGARNAKFGARPADHRAGATSDGHQSKARNKTRQGSGKKWLPADHQSVGPARAGRGGCEVVAGAQAELASDVFQTGA